ncbi:MAG: cyclase family protein [Pseudomonadota bacterium]
MTIIDTNNMRVIDLEHPRTSDMPEYPTHRPGYAYTLYHRHEDFQNSGVRSSAFGQLHGTEHAGTHIDAVCHQAENMKLHGNIAVTAEIQTPTGFTRHGAENFPPMFADGILLDVAALKGVPSLEAQQPVTAEDLEACCARQNVTIGEGSVALVNLGNSRFWHDEARYVDGPGMSPSASEWMVDKGVMAVGADNMGWDLIPGWDEALGCNGPGHILLLVRAGIYIIENLDLTELVDSGHSTFTFVALPLKLVGATGSPIRPVALVPK